MKRFFYPANRAHHAYCMAIDFGMKFETSKGGRWETESLPHLRGATDYKIFVAEESHQLLDSRVCDLVSYIDDSGGYGIGTVTEAPYQGEDNEQLFCVDDGNAVLAENMQRIIERGGKPFHWPESEQA